MSDLVRLNPLDGMAEAIARNEQMRTAFGVVQSVNTGFRIASREEAESAADTLAVLKRGERTASEAITNAMRPYKAAEAQARSQLVAPLLAASAKVAAEMNRWRVAEQSRVRREQLEAEQQARAAAEAAAVNAAGLGDDEEPLPAAQVIIPQQERIVRGAIGKTHELRRLKAVEIVNAVEVAQEWPHVVVEAFATSGPARSSAKAEYEALLKRGTADMPPEGEGIVKHGVRFVTEVTIVSGAAR